MFEVSGAYIIRGIIIQPSFFEVPLLNPLSTLTRIREAGQTGWRREFVDGDRWRVQTPGIPGKPPWPERQDPQFYP